MATLSHRHIFVPGSDPARPPLLLLHGTGGDEHDLVPLAQRLSPGSALLSPRGQVSENGANRFFARLAEGVFDPAEVAQRTHELADFIAAASAQYRIGAGLLFGIGFSNGANIATTLLQLRPTALAGAVLLRPMVVLNQPARLGSLEGKRVLIASGEFDPIVPKDHPRRLAALLEAGGAEVRLHGAPAGHHLSSSDLAIASDFLRNE